MAYFDTPMTKLDAVNVCLSAMGEPSINELETAGADAQIASDIVDEISRSVQGIGWHWNRESHTISPDINGWIVLPANTLRVDSVDEDKTVDVIQRGTRLYNREENSYSFENTVKVDIVAALPFEEIPFAARNFIAYRAARVMQQRTLGSDTLQKFNERDEQRAWTMLMQDEADISDTNLINDSWSSASIVTRGSFSRSNY